MVEIGASKMTNSDYWGLLRDKGDKVSKENSGSPKSPVGYSSSHTGAAALPQEDFGKIGLYVTKPNEIYCAE